MIKNKFIKYTKYFKQYDEAFNKFQNTAIGKFVIEKLILRKKSFYSILSTFGLILVAQMSAYNNIMQWSNKVDEQLNNSDGWIYAGWFIVSFIVPSGNIAVIVVLVLILIVASIIRYKELSEDSEISIQQNRNKLFLKELEDKAINYVITENHDRLITKLEENHVVIISGEPGIGKSTALLNMVNNIAMVLTLAAGLGLLPACWLSERVRKRHGLLRFHGILMNNRELNKPGSRPRP